MHIRGELIVVNPARIGRVQAKNIRVHRHRRVDAVELVAESIRLDDLVVLWRFFHRRPADGADIGDDVVAITAAEKVVCWIAIY